MVSNLRILPDTKAFFAIWLIFYLFTRQRWSRQQLHDVNGCLVSTQPLCQPSPSASPTTPSATATPVTTTKTSKVDDCRPSSYSNALPHVSDNQEDFAFLALFINKFNNTVPSIRFRFINDSNLSVGVTWTWQGPAVTMALLEVHHHHRGVPITSYSNRDLTTTITPTPTWTTSTTMGTTWWGREAHINHIHLQPCNILKVTRTLHAHQHEQ